MHCFLGGTVVRASDFRSTGLLTEEHCVIPYGKLHPVVLRWVFHEELTLTNIHYY